MRLGLDLRSIADAEQRCALAVEADRLGLWAVLLDSTIEAAALAPLTEHVHLAVVADAEATQPIAVAEAIAVVDQLSRRRALAIVAGSAGALEHVRRLVHHEIVDGVALAPPPAQTALPVWSVDAIDPIELSGDLGTDRATVDRLRDAGRTHAFVRWPGELAVFARHLETRARTPDFPQVVADMADRIEPLD